MAKMAVNLTNKANLLQIYSTKFSQICTAKFSAQICKIFCLIKSNLSVNLAKFTSLALNLISNLIKFNPTLNLSKNLSNLNSNQIKIPNLKAKI